MSWQEITIQGAIFTIFVVIPAIALGVWMERLGKRWYQKWQKNQKPKH